LVVIGNRVDYLVVEDGLVGSYLVVVAVEGVSFSTGTSDDGNLASFDF
jgi:hypothetical protein